MGERILNLILKLAVLGAIAFLAYAIFSDNIKDFHITVSQNSIEINSAYYKD